MNRKRGHLALVQPDGQPPSERLVTSGVEVQQEVERRLEGLKQWVLSQARQAILQQGNTPETQETIGKMCAMVQYCLEQGTPAMLNGLMADALQLTWEKESGKR